LVRKVSFDASFYFANARNEYFHKYGFLVIIKYNLLFCLSFIEIDLHFLDFNILFLMQNFSSGVSINKKTSGNVFYEFLMMKVEKKTNLSII